MFDLDFMLLILGCWCLMIIWLLLSTIRLIAATCHYALTRRQYETICRFFNRHFIQWTFLKAEQLLLLTDNLQAHSICFTKGSIAILYTKDGIDMLQTLACCPCCPYFSLLCDAPLSLKHALDDCTIFKLRER